MKKKLVSALLCATMATSLLAGCGSGNASDTGSADKKGDAKTEVTNDGKILNIYCWNEEFQSRITDHYPDYKKVDATHGKIGDVDVVWNITPSENNAYQNNLDETLLKQADASADDKIDLFLVEADYAPKYVDSDYTMPIKDLGITDSDISKQYKYTQDVVTDSDGNLKGLSWQGCPGVLFYNRAAAKEVLGTDDPDEVQKSVSDWDTFNATAEKMKAAGYKMTSTANDTYRVYSNNVSKKWVSDDKKIQIDDNIMKWVDDSKKLVDAGETGTADLWSDDWKKGFYPEGKVFSYFGPAWLVNFSMAADESGSIGNQGGWGAAQGPQGFFWGGTWLLANKDTQKKEAVKDILEWITLDSSEEGLQYMWANGTYNGEGGTKDCVASGTVMSKSDGSVDFLGGQNMFDVFVPANSYAKGTNLTQYDETINTYWREQVREYTAGNKSREQAIADFKQQVADNLDVIVE